MKYACGMVLYNPDYENIEKLKQIVDEFDLFFVWDNSENNKFMKNIKKMQVEYYCRKKNFGLAKPYNFFIELSAQSEMDFLCILDQDTKISSENIKEIKKNIEKNYSDQNAIYAPRLKGTIEKKWVINSNSFLNIKTVRKYNIKYDEFYFLDRLDIDFCTQITNKNLNIIIFEDIIIDHQIGEKENSNHSEIRHYYMFRNRIYYNEKYFPFIQAKFLTLLQNLKHILIILLYEKNKKNKIQQLYKAKCDYKKERKGDQL